MQGKVGFCRICDVFALGVVHGGRRTVPCGFGGAAGAGFDFDKDEEVAVFGDNVNFFMRQVQIAFQNGIAAVAQVTCRGIFADFARFFLIGHDGVPSFRSVS